MAPRRKYVAVGNIDSKWVDIVFKDVTVRMPHTGSLDWGKKLLAKLDEMREVVVQDIDTRVTARKSDKSKTFDEAMDAAMKSYAEGIPVVIQTADLDEGGEVLHGIETLEMVVRSNPKLRVTNINHVSAEDFRASDYPRILNEAREKWLVYGSAK